MGEHKSTNEEPWICMINSTHEFLSLCLSGSCSVTVGAKVAMDTVCLTTLITTIDTTITQIQVGCLLSC